MKQKDGKLPFLDVNIFHENGKFVTNVYRKETSAGGYTNFSSFIPLGYKFGLTHMLLHHCFCLISDMSKFHFEIEKLKEIHLMNGYSNKFIEKCIFKFMNKLFVKKHIVFIVHKKKLYIVLQFMGRISALGSSSSGLACGGSLKLGCNPN